MNTRSTKTCPKCGESKPKSTDYFHPKRESYGIRLSFVCRVCDNRLRVERRRRARARLEKGHEHE